MDLNLTNLVLPKRVEKKPGAEPIEEGEFIIAPLERGFGTTLGNALRRVLLSSLEGAAIWGIKARGVLHELSAVPGIVEDVPDIVLNLKGLIFAMDPDVDQVVLHLAASEAGQVTAQKIEANPKIRIINPQIHLLTLQDSRPFEMDIFVRRGRGYVPADQHPMDHGKEIGFIPVDSVFNPVVKVNYIVENTRVGQRTDYDKLTLQVLTNGAITPEEAVAYGAELLRKHLEYFLTFEEAREREDPASLSRRNRLKELFARSVDELELSVRAGNCLKASNIRTLGDLVQKTEAEMLKFRNFGRKSLKEIQEILEKHGLRFGMRFEYTASGDLRILDEGVPPSQIILGEEDEEEEEPEEGHEKVRKGKGSKKDET